MGSAAVVVFNALALSALAAQPSTELAALLEDERAALADKRASLRQYVEAQPTPLSWSDAEVLDQLVSTARPFEHLYELCLDLAGLLPADVLQTKEVRVESYDQWGAPTSALVDERGRIYSTGHVRRREVPRCLPGLFVRFVPDGPTVAAPFIEGVAVARLPGRGPLASVSGFFEAAIVPRGWGEAERVYVGGGIRGQLWRRYVHLDLALKLSTFSAPWLLETPGGLAIDFFVGYPFELPSQTIDARISLDIGLWSSFCPSLRVSAALVAGRFFAGVELGLHLYPMALAPQYDRPANQRNLTLGNYLFLGPGLSLGYSL